MTVGMYLSQADADKTALSLDTKISSGDVLKYRKISQILARFLEPGHWVMLKIASSRIIAANCDFSCVSVYVSQADARNFEP